MPCFAGSTSISTDVVEHDRARPPQLPRRRDRPAYARTRMPAARAASPPSRLSSTTAHAAGRTPICAAAWRKRSGAGLPLSDLVGAEDPAVESLVEAGRARASAAACRGCRSTRRRSGRDPLERVEDALDRRELARESRSYTARTALPSRRAACAEVGLDLGLGVAPERPTNRSITSAFAQRPPELGERLDLDPHRSRSLSTSTPSQSKITSSNGIGGPDQIALAGGSPGDRRRSEESEVSPVFAECSAGSGPHSVSPAAT